MPGLAGFAAALLFNPVVLRALSPDGNLLPYTTRRTWAFAAIFLAIGLAHAALLALIRRRGVDRWLAARTRRTGIAFAIGATVMMVLAIDAALGVKVAGFNFEPHLLDPDPVYEFRMKPSVRVFYVSAHVETNSRRLRGPEIAPAPPPGTRRILVLGDSVAFGYGVVEEDSFPAQLEAQLGAGHEVINAAVTGYQFHHYYYMAQDTIDLQPDEVLLGVCLNDLPWTRDDRLRGNPATGDCRPAERTPFNRLKWYVQFHSGLLNIPKFFREEHGLRLPEEYVDWERRTIHRLVDEPAHRARRLEVARCYLRAIKRHYDERGVAFRVVIFPYRFQLDPEETALRPDHAEVQRGLVDVCNELGIPVIDLLDPIAREIARQDLDPDDLFFDLDHFTEEGNTLCARLVAQEMQGADGR